MTIFRKPTEIAIPVLPTTRPDPPTVEIRFVEKWKHLTGGVVPKPKTAGSAAFDLVVCASKEIILLPRSRIKVSTGICLHIADPGIAALVLPRSGLAHDHGIVLKNAVGLIDSDYQGELFLSIWNTGTSYTLNPGNRVAQLVFVPIIHPEFSIVDEFTAITQRGTGGFGSTG